MATMPFRVRVRRRRTVQVPLSETPGRVYVRFAAAVRDTAADPAHQLVLDGVSPAAWSDAVRRAGPDGFVEVVDQDDNVVAIVRSHIVSYWAMASSDPPPPVARFVPPRVEGI